MNHNNEDDLDEAMANVMRLTEGSKVKRRPLNKPIVSLHPKRETIINEEDISNLKIALGTAKDVREFMSII